MVDHMESMREIHEKLEELKKRPHTKKAILELRQKILIGIKADLKTGKQTPIDERFNRLQGYYSYIISYKLEDIIEERNWIVGVILSAAALDDIGKLKLKWQLKGKIKPEKIENLNFEETIMLLLASGLVAPKTYQKLMEIKKVRNDLAHDSDIAMSIFLQTGSIESQECKKCKSAIEKAVFCLRALYPLITPQA
jgi:hypothetical protein